jgi:hypothetical protein
MSILAHNLYRLLALELTGYRHSYPRKIYNDFILNSGNISIHHDRIDVIVNNNRTLPILFNTNYTYSWLNNLPLEFIKSSTT